MFCGYLQENFTETFSKLIQSPEDQLYDGNRFLDGNIR